LTDILLTYVLLNNSSSHVFSLLGLRHSLQSVDEFNCLVTVNATHFYKVTQ